MEKNKFNLWLPVIIAIFSFIANSQFQSCQDRKNKLRDVKIGYLIEAYRNLAYSSTRPIEIEKYQRTMESAISDIQLFGSKKEIKKLNKMIDRIYISNDSVKLELDEILLELRNSLRIELNLDTVNSNIRWVRFKETINP